MGDKGAPPLIGKYNLIVGGILCGVLFWMLEALVHTLFLSDGPYVREIFVLDAHELWTRFTVFALLVGFGWFGQRIVDRQRRLRMRLAESEERFRAIFDQTYEFIGLLSLDGTLIEANRSALEFAGIDESSVLGKPFWETPWWSHSSELQSRLRKAVQRAAAGEFVRFEASHPAANGAIHYMDVSIKPVKDKDGKVILLIPEGHDVTEHKLAEETLRESEEKFRLLSEQSLLGIVIVQDDLVKYFNEAARQLIEYSAEEVMAWEPGGLARIWHPDDRSFIVEQMRKKQSGETDGIVTHYAYRMITKQGTMKWVDQFSKTITYRGRPADLATLIDITERKKAEKALQEEKLLSEEYINSMPGLFYVFDEERFVRWNNRWERATGYSDEELVGMYGPDFFAGDDRTLISERMQKVFSEGAAEAEADLVTKDGRRIPYYFTGLRKEINGKPHLVGLGIDITRRREAEKALQESEETFGSVVKSSPMGIYIYQLEDDNRLVLIGANPAASHLTGVDNSPFIGMTIEEAFPPLVDTEIPERYRRAAGHGENWFTEQVNYDHGGIAGAFEVYAFQMSPGKAAVLFNNITKRKRVEAELAEYRDHLEELVEKRTRQLRETQEELIQTERLAALGKVTAMVSHELRNPLGTVRTSVFSIGEAIKKDDRKRAGRSLELAERNIVRCDNIIDELLNFSRTRDLQLEGTELDDWLARLLDEGIVPGEIICVRELNCGREVFIDRERMRRVVINVLTNAVHTMQEDGDSGARLTVSTRVHDGRLEICFEDSGNGIPEKDLGRVFEPMFSTKNFGVGLGLPIVQGIMQQHGGDAEIRNNTDKGATVTLWLPLSTLGKAGR